MSIKPILNNPDALNNKSLNLWSNSINVNDLETTNIIASGSISADSVNCSLVNTTNVSAENVNASNIKASNAVLSNRKIQTIDPTAPLTLFTPDVNIENEYIITQLNATYNPAAGATCQGIAMTDSQANSGLGYEMTITAMSAGVVLQDAVPVSPPLRPFSLGGVNYSLSPTQNQTLSVRVIWRPELQAWVRVGL